MQKVPTIFERDWDGDRSRVTPTPTPGCEWVFAGEGIATRKLDGTACMIRDGVLYKRRELRGDDAEPPGIFVSADEKTGKRILWVEVGDGPEDRWHRDAYLALDYEDRTEGTYELVGPKIQGNPEGFATHTLVPHNSPALIFADQPPRTFAGLHDWFLGQNVEGIVFHRSDGLMGKIKSRDFGIRRPR